MVLSPVWGLESVPCGPFSWNFSLGTSAHVFSLLLLLLSHFSRVRLCATPQTAAHQAPPSLGFSRQEHWSGLLFPSPMRKSESEVAQSCPTPSPQQVREDGPQQIPEFSVWLWPLQCSILYTLFLPEISIPSPQLRDSSGFFLRSPPCALA